MPLTPPLHHRSNSPIDRLERFGRRNVPASVAPALKMWIAYPRFYYQMAVARRRAVHSSGPAHPIFVVGLPKSGSSWLASMVADLSGRAEVSLPSVAVHTYRRAESHTFSLKGDRVAGLRLGATVAKLHMRASDGNAQTVCRIAPRSVVVYRDLRDVVVSYTHYVRRTPYHPEYADYARMEVSDGYDRFIERWLPDYQDWVAGWVQEASRPELLFLHYEDLVQNPVEMLTKVNLHLGLEQSEERIREVIRRHSFAALTGGRASGQADPDSFLRKGVAGDWKEQLTASQLERIYEVTGPPDATNIYLKSP